MTKTATITRTSGSNPNRNNRPQYDWVEELTILPRRYTYGEVIVTMGGLTITFPLREGKNPSRIYATIQGEGAFSLLLEGEALNQVLSTLLNSQRPAARAAGRLLRERGVKTGYGQTVPSPPAKQATRLPRRRRHH